MAEGSLLDRKLAPLLGKRTADGLATLGLHTVGDLMYHFPRRYHSATSGGNLSRLVVGEHVTAVAEVVNTTSISARTGVHFILKVDVQDSSGARAVVTLITRTRKGVEGWRRMLPAGTRALFDGTVKMFQGRTELSNARFFPLKDWDSSQLAVNDELLIPIYPAGAKVPTWNITRSVKTILPLLDDVHEELPDPIPLEILATKGWPSVNAALRMKHDPRTQREIQIADERLRFEEAFVLQTALARRRQQSSALAATPRTAAEGGLLSAFDAALPFELTAGQRQAAADIARDIGSEHPMHRLLQGEVGSGKTIVALRAMLTVVDAGGQAAMLAPTEVLAQQHHRSITAMMGNLASAGMLQLSGPTLADDSPGTEVVLLTGSLGARAKREALAKVASGQAGLVIGTHALLQDTVEFDDLGLVVVDEQHRFGVEQRDALRAKALRTPHLLVMTATPIPRTVAMTVFGDLETSVMREVPAGRQPIASHVVPVGKPAWIARMWEVVADQVSQGRQAYVVCPAIDPAPAGPGSRGASLTDGAFLPGFDQEPEPGELVSVTEMMATLTDEPALQGLRLGMLHGRMSAEDKDTAMQAFVSGQVDVLISTTVIEVGVDVPNASVMVVMDASRFGVSQLHQLRGRVGRGGHAGFCFLVASQFAGQHAVANLEKVAATRDGFELARLDLENRREGDVLGAAQSGRMSSLRVLRVTRDEDVIAEARELASELVGRDPDLAGQPELRRAIQILLAPEREVFLERG